MWPLEALPGAALPAARREPSAAAWPEPVDVEAKYKLQVQTIRSVMITSIMYDHDCDCMF